MDGERPRPKLSAWANDRQITNKEFWTVGAWATDKPAGNTRPWS